MNKFTAIVILSSALMLTACDQAEEATDKALEGGADLMEMLPKPRLLQLILPLK